MSDILHRLRLANGVMLDAEREEAATEIERLRGMNAGLQTAFDEANEETRRYGELLRSENRRIVEHEKEIERLRGLLREHLLGSTEVMTWRQAHEWHEDYLKRVREALGDD